MLGYWKQPELTAAALGDGWLRTGDMAVRDDEGYVYIVDRKKDMIVSGGFNMFPREIEDVLATHPAVSDAAVIGVPDAKWGEAVKALVVRAAGRRVTRGGDHPARAGQEGPVYAPKSVEFLDALPLTPVGKADKKVLRARYWAGQTREGELKGPPPTRRRPVRIDTCTIADAVRSERQGRPRHRRQPRPRPRDGARVRPRRRGRGDREPQAAGLRGDGGRGRGATGRRALPVACHVGDWTQVEALAEAAYRGSARSTCS